MIARRASSHESFNLVTQGVGALRLALPDLTGQPFILLADTGSRNVGSEPHHAVIGRKARFLDHFAPDLFVARAWLQSLRELKSDWVTRCGESNLRYCSLTSCLSSVGWSLPARALHAPVRGWPVGTVVVQDSSPLLSSKYLARDRKRYVRVPDDDAVI